MGWASGSSLLSDIIEIIEEVAHADTDKIELFTQLIEAFEDHDCDTIDECVGQSPNFDIAYDNLYGDEEDEDDALAREQAEWEEHREESWGGNYD